MTPRAVHPLNWKDRYRDAIYASAELRPHKAQRSLLEFLVHKTHSKLLMCWVSQTEMADVSGCNERNVKRLLVALQSHGCLMPVRFSELPPKDRKAITGIRQQHLSNNANVYFLCLGWADEVLSAPPAPQLRRGQIHISETDRKRGTQKANERRRRYPPATILPELRGEANPDHEDWLFLNAVDGKGGRSETPFKPLKGGRSATDISIDRIEAASAAHVSYPGTVASAPASSQAEHLTTSISSLPSERSAPYPHGYGVGTAVASGSKAPGLGPAEGTRPEGTEFGAARAHERRKS
ncbi:hypothetical protein [Rhizobium sp. Leaf383]|uniref:hypothetical protein n=1 Tax=Rhizobium sp. Leaf383 TaxID=1736357 RepID=UPI0007129E46|nr:hypothetical protein [Rhizobium sp. Leaf383]KQS83440.1 hypothetical protein ASG58_22160 [Rhizobium sp. Leaf383]